MNNLASNKQLDPKTVDHSVTNLDYEKECIENMGEWFLYLIFKYLNRGLCNKRCRVEILE